MYKRLLYDNLSIYSINNDPLDNSNDYNYDRISNNSFYNTSNFINNQNNIITNININNYYDNTIYNELNNKTNNIIDPKQLDEIDHLKLDIYNNIIPPFLYKMINLIKLDLSSNDLTYIDNNITSLTNLIDLNLSYNKIELINILPTNLTNLNLCFNNITSIDNIIPNLSNLQKLNLECNYISCLNNINNLIHLTELRVNYNKLIEFPNISNLTNLYHLRLSYNNLTILPDYISNLVNLHSLCITYNNITTIPPSITNNNHLYLFYTNNPIQYVAPNVIRWLNNIKHNQNIYEDKQNVHNHNIQQSIIISINKLLSDKPLINDNIYELIINDNILTDKTKEVIIEYCNDNEIHSLLNLTFKEIFIYVWSRILCNEHKNEIKQILNEEMNNSICKCFTGRISRLINCLNGFDDDIKINISDNEQIGNIISNVGGMLEKSNNYSIYEHRRIVKKELEERGYDSSIIEEWLNYIE